MNFEVFASVNIESTIFWSGTGVATRLQAWPFGVRIPVGVRDFSLLHNFQTGSGVYPVFHSMVPGFFPGGKAAEARSYVPLSNAEAVVKNEWSYTSTPLYAFVTWAGKTLIYILNCVGV
jgi:hypothetical protein